MTDDGVGRLLVASLHQSISDVVPTRLEYYEHWLSPMGLREGRSGRAPLGAVLSFLRQEGEATYTTVMTLAGQHAAEWRHADGGVGRRAAAWMPKRLRRGSALREVKALLRATYQPLVVTTALKRDTGTVTLDGSVFCALREPWPWPTCAFAASAVTRHLELHGLDATVAIDSCRALAGSGTCRLLVHFDRPSDEVAA